MSDSPNCPVPAGVNLHLTFTGFRNESRALREGRSLLSAGFFREVHFVSNLLDDDQSFESIGPGLQVERVAAHSFRDRAHLKGRLGRILEFAEWTLRVSVGQRGRPVRVIHCHSLPCLPASTILHAISGAPIVYDAHELETERMGWSLPLRLGAKILEVACLPAVSTTLVVSESIRTWYRRHRFMRSIHTVRNLPRRPSSLPRRTGILRRALGLREADFVCLYQGAMGNGRGINVLLESFAEVRDKHLVFMGYGPDVDKVLMAASTCANIHYLAAVPPDVLYDYTADADVGLALIEDQCLSYRYCLPNKLFEYMVCGVPVIASDLPEMRRSVESLLGGWVVEPTVAKLVPLLRSIERDGRSLVANGLQERALSCTWDADAEVLLNAYRDVLRAEE